VDVSGLLGSLSSSNSLNCEKRRVGIDYLKNIFNNGAFIMMGKR
jgi:hypothetical protein